MKYFLILFMLFTVSGFFHTAQAGESAGFGTTVPALPVYGGDFSGGSDGGISNVLQTEMDEKWSFGLNVAVKKDSLSHMKPQHLHGGSIPEVSGEEKGVFLGVGLRYNF